MISFQAFWPVTKRRSSASWRLRSYWASGNGLSVAGVERFEDEGEAGLLDRRLGKASSKRVPQDRSDEVEALYRTRYAASRPSISTSIW